MKVDVKGFEPELRNEIVERDLAQINEILAGVWADFVKKYSEYGEGAADALGLAGQWGDLHRKVMKLRRSFWVGESGYLVSENERQILADMIGHCLLAMHMLDRDMTGGRR